MTEMKVLVFVTCAAILLSATETTIRVPLSSEVTDIVTFDPTRVSPADVKRWILLSKEGPYSGAEVSPRKQLAKLRAEKYPPELADNAANSQHPANPDLGLPTLPARSHPSNPQARLDFEMLQCQGCRRPFVPIPDLKKSASRTN